MFDLLFALKLLPVLALLYYYIHKKYSYWSAKGVPGPRPIFPFGYWLERAITFPEHFEQQHAAKYGKVYGLYTGLTPTLTLCDAQLIKEVLVKQFPLYLNRRLLNPQHDIWNHNMFFQEGADWKRLRSITTPAFTSGKLRGMYGLMGQCIERLEEFFERTTTQGNGLINTKEVMAGFTIDVIASSAFATATNANDTRENTNPVVYHGLNLFRFNPFKVMACLALPRSILQLLNFTTFFPADSFQFFIDLTSQIVKQRRSSSNKLVKHNDLVQLMMDSFAYEEDLAKDEYDSLAVKMENDDAATKVTSATSDNQTKKQMTTKEIIAQSVLFLVAGFETTATSMTHLLFELAKQPHLQQRLVDELNQQTAGIDPKNLEQFYDVVLNNCPYLDAVSKEILRKYPPVIRLERRVVADSVKLGGIELDKDVIIEISTLAVHRNPEYYPEPERFNPDRFMPENKSKLQPYTYLPFGDGPRNCVGMRFAYQEIKLCMATILQKYRFSPTPKTPEKLAFLKGQFMMNCIPFELSVSKR